MPDQKEIVEGLRCLGLETGDIVLLHSALSSLGRVEGGAEAVVEAFLTVLGSQGTLIVPVFGSLGVITETVKNRPGAVVSNHPFACVAAVGAEAERICADHWRADTAHGANTPYTRIAELGGYVCLLGVDQDRNTTLHTVETLLELPYLNDRTGAVETGTGTVEKTWRYFPGPHRNFIGLDRSLREQGIMRVGRIGSGVVRLMKSREMIEHCLEIGKQNPAFVLCDNPNCPDCRWQRGKVKQARFQAENVEIAVSSILAGKYVPEMIANLTPSGISRLELDYFEGMPVDNVSAERLEQGVKQLQKAGVETVALRTGAYGSVNLQLLDKAAHLGIRRLVVPLHAGCEPLLEKASDRKVAVSFYNLGVSSQAAADILLALADQGLQPKFTFNPGNFAAIGEKPFLSSFKTKVKKFIDQLDICDCTFAAERTELAGGNAEIKEMISILRGSSFAGSMVLTAGNAGIYNPESGADRVLSLLDCM